MQIYLYFLRLTVILVKSPVNCVTAVSGDCRTFALVNSCEDATVEDGTPIHGAEAANADREAREIATLAK